MDEVQKLLLEIETRLKGNDEALTYLRALTSELQKASVAPERIQQRLLQLATAIDKLSPSIQKFIIQFERAFGGEITESLGQAAAAAQKSSKFLVDSLQAVAKAAREADVSEADIGKALVSSGLEQYLGRVVDELRKAHQEALAFAQTTQEKLFGEGLDTVSAERVGKKLKTIADSLARQPSIDPAEYYRRFYQEAGQVVEEGESALRDQMRRAQAQGEKTGAAVTQAGDAAADAMDKGAREAKELESAIEQVVAQTQDLIDQWSSDLFRKGLSTADATSFANELGGILDKLTRIKGLTAEEIEIRFQAEAQDVIDEARLGIKPPPSKESQVAAAAYQEEVALVQKLTAELDVPESFRAGLRDVVASLTSLPGLKSPLTTVEQHVRDFAASLKALPAPWQEFVTSLYQRQPDEVIAQLAKNGRNFGVEIVNAARAGIDANHSFASVLIDVEDRMRDLAEAAGEVRVLQEAQPAHGLPRVVIGVPHGLAKAASETLQTGAADLEVERRNRSNEISGIDREIAQGRENLAATKQELAAAEAAGVAKDIDAAQQRLTAIEKSLVESDARRRAIITTAYPTTGQSRLQAEDTERAEKEAAAVKATAAAMAELRVTTAEVDAAIAQGGFELGKLVRTLESSGDTGVLRVLRKEITELIVAAKQSNVALGPEEIFGKLQARKFLDTGLRDAINDIARVSEEIQDLEATIENISKRPHVIIEPSELDTLGEKLASLSVALDTLGKEAEQTPDVSERLIKRASIQQARQDLQTITEQVRAQKRVVEEGGAVVVSQSAVEGANRLYEKLIADQRIAQTEEQRLNRLVEELRAKPFALFSPEEAQRTLQVLGDMRQRLADIISTADTRAPGGLIQREQAQGQVDELLKLREQIVPQLGQAQIVAPMRGLQELDQVYRQIAVDAQSAATSQRAAASIQFNPQQTRVVREFLETLIAGRAVSDSQAQGIRNLYNQIGQAERVQSARQALQDLSATGSASESVMSELARAVRDTGQATDESRGGIRGFLEDLQRANALRLRYEMDELSGVIARQIPLVGALLNPWAHLVSTLNDFLRTGGPLRGVFAGIEQGLQRVTGFFTGVLQTALGFVVGNILLAPFNLLGHAIGSVTNNFGGLIERAARLNSEFGKTQYQVEQASQVWDKFLLLLTRPTYEFIVGKLREIGRALGDSFGASDDWSKNIQTLGAALGASLQKGVQYIYQWAEEIARAVLGQTGPLNPQDWLNAGAELAGNFGKGLIEGFLAFVPLLTQVIATVADFIIGHSPPPRGPLKEIITGAAATMKAWIQGLTQVDLGPLDELVSRVEGKLDSVRAQAAQVAPAQAAQTPVGQIADATVVAAPAAAASGRAAGESYSQNESAALVSAQGQVVDAATRPLQSAAQQTAQMGGSAGAEWGRSFVDASAMNLGGLEDRVANQIRFGDSIPQRFLGNVNWQSVWGMVQGQISSGLQMALTNARLVAERGSNAIATAMAQSQYWAQAGQQAAASFQNGLQEAMAQSQSFIQGALSQVGRPLDGLRKLFRDNGSQLTQEWFRGMLQADFSAIDQLAGLVQSRLDISIALKTLDPSAAVAQIGRVRDALAQVVAEMTTLGYVSASTLSSISGYFGDQFQDVLLLIGALEQYQKQLQLVESIQDGIRALEEAMHAYQRAVQQAELEMQLAYQKAQYAIQDIQNRITMFEMNSSEIPERFTRGRKRELDLELFRAQVRAQQLEREQQATRVMFQIRQQQMQDELYAAQKGLEREQRTLEAKRAQLTFAQQLIAEDQKRNELAAQLANNMAGLKNIQIDPKLKEKLEAMFAKAGDILGAKLEAPFARLKFFLEGLGGAQLSQFQLKNMSAEEKAAYGEGQKLREAFNKGLQAGQKLGENLMDILLGLSGNAPDQSRGETAAYKAGATIRGFLQEVEKTWNLLNPDVQKIILLVLGLQAATGVPGAIVIAGAVGILAAALRGLWGAILAAPAVPTALARLLGLGEKAAPEIAKEAAPKTAAKAAPKAAEVATKAVEQVAPKVAAEAAPKVAEQAAVQAAARTLPKTRKIAASPLLQRAEALAEAAVKPVEELAPKAVHSTERAFALEFAELPSMVGETASKAGAETAKKASAGFLEKIAPLAGKLVGGIFKFFTSGVVGGIATGVDIYLLFKDFFDDLVKPVTRAFDEMGAHLFDVVSKGNLGDLLGDKFSDVFEGVGQNMQGTLESISGIFFIISGAFEAGILTLANIIIVPLRGFLTGDWQGAWNDFVSSLEGAKVKLLVGIELLKQGIGDSIEGMVTAVGSILQRFADAFLRPLKDLWDEFWGASIGHDIIDAVKEFAKFFEDFTLPDLSRFADFLLEPLQSAWDNVFGAQGLVEKIKTSFGGFRDFLSNLGDFLFGGDALSGLKDGLGKIGDALGPLTSLFGQKDSAPKIDTTQVATSAADITKTLDTLKTDTATKMSELVGAQQTLLTSWSESLTKLSNGAREMLDGLVVRQVEKFIEWRNRAIESINGLVEGTLLSFGALPVGLADVMVAVEETIFKHLYFLEENWNKVWARMAQTAAQTMTYLTPGAQGQLGEQGQIPGYAAGGIVKQTGVAMVHAGELVGTPRRVVELLTQNFSVLPADVPQLAVGGRVERAGVAVVHPRESVIPDKMLQDLVSRALQMFSSFSAGGVDIPFAPSMRAITANAAPSNTNYMTFVHNWPETIGRLSVGEFERIAERAAYRAVSQVVNQ